MNKNKSNVRTIKANHVCRRNPGYRETSRKEVGATGQAGAKNAYEPETIREVVVAFPALIPMVHMRRGHYISSECHDHVGTESGAVADCGQNVTWLSSYYLFPMSRVSSVQKGG